MFETPLWFDVVLCLLLLPISVGLMVSIPYSYWFIKNALIRWSIDFKPASEDERYLQDMADSLLPMFNRMARVKVRLVDTPIKEHQSDNGSVANCLDNSLISVKREYFSNADAKRLVSTMKHELTHAWIHWKRVKINDPHGPAFQKKLAEVNAIPTNIKLDERRFRKTKTVKAAAK